MQALGMAVAEGLHEPFEPRVIAHCFARRDHMPEARPRLTMQGWIDLEAARSPFLLEEPSQEPMRDVEIALRALGWDAEIEELRRRDWRGRRKITVPRLAELTVQILAALRERHSTGIAMAPAGGGKRAEHDMESSLEDDGFGNWGPVMACLLSELRFSLKEALGCDVSAAFALIAAMRRNQGWKACGDHYRAREVDGSTAIEPQMDADEHGLGGEPEGSSSSSGSSGGNE